MAGTMRGAFFGIKRNWMDDWTPARQAKAEKKIEAWSSHTADIVRAMKEDVGLEAFCLMSLLARFVPSYAKAMKRFKNNQPQAFEICSDRCKYVEIFRGELCHRVYFPVPRKCIEIYPIKLFFAHVDQAFHAVNRDTVEQKAFEFSTACKNLCEELTFIRLLLSGEEGTWVGDLVKSLLYRHAFFNQAGFNCALFQVTASILFFGRKDCPFCELDGVYLSGFMKFMNFVLSFIQVHVCSPPLSPIVLIRVPFLSGIYEHRHPLCIHDRGCPRAAPITPQ